MTADKSSHPRVTINIQGNGISNFEVVKTGTKVEKTGDGEIKTDVKGSDKVELKGDGSVTITTD